MTLIFIVSQMKFYCLDSASSIILTIGPLQLAIHMVQNRRAGEQKSYWDKTNKENYHFKLCMSFCLSCPSATFALQHGSFVPREWPAAKGLFVISSLPFI